MALALVKGLGSFNMDEVDLQHFCEAVLMPMTLPAAMTSLAVAVGFRRGRILNVPHPPSLHNSVETQEMLLLFIY